MVPSRYETTRPRTGTAAAVFAFVATHAVAAVAADTVVSRADALSGADTVVYPVQMLLLQLKMLLLVVVLLLLLLLVVLYFVPL